jgi:hypothetical protein
VAEADLERFLDGERIVDRFGGRAFVWADAVDGEAGDRFRVEAHGDGQAAAGGG